jgi:TolB protein
MDAAGGSLVPVDLPGAQVSFPAWSPDGSRIAALVTDQSGATIQVVAASPSLATQPVTLYRSTDEPPFYLSWSTDGRSVAFLTTEPGGIALRRAPADASADATRLRDGSPMYWADLADGRLLVHAGSGAGSFLGEIGADGKDHDDGLDATGPFRAPALSADGTYRAYAGTTTDGAAAVVTEAADGAARHDVPIFGPSALSFAPSGATVAFLARPSADAPQTQLPVGPLRAIDAADGSVRTLLSGSVVAFFWSPDGRTIAALSIPTSGDGVAQAGVRLARAPVPVAAPGLALDLVFVDATDGSIVARQVVRVSDVFASQLLPYFDQYALSHRIWSPDSGAIALPVVAADGSNEIDVIATDGSAARRVAAGVLAFWSP